MPFLDRLENDATVWDIFKSDKHIYGPFLSFVEELMRGPSSLSEGERELIAAYVSGLNACQYCFSSHVAVAIEFGIDECLFEELMNDLETSSIDNRFREILAFVRKLTLEQSRITQADVKAVFNAGWDEKTFRDSVSICCLFNYMNRLVHAYDIRELSPERLKAGAEATASLGYKARFEKVVNQGNK